MKKIVAILFLSVAFTQAQTIEMDFPHFAGKTYDFIIFQGDKQETVLKDTIPADGKFSLKIPGKYAPYTGMSRWLITGTAEGGGLDMPIPGKDFSVSCLVAQPTEETIIYKGNTDAALLNSLFREQNEIVQKSTAVNSVLQAYDKKEKNYPIYEEEYKKQQKAYADFQQKLTKNQAYAARVFNVFGMISGIGTKLTTTENETAEDMASYIADQLDFNMLYTSGHWTSIIASWVDMHTLVLKDKNAFAADFSKIEKKISDKTLFTDFAGKIAYFLTKKGEDEYIAAISPVVNGSGKIEKYEGSMKAYLTNLVGQQAPDILLVEHVGNVNDHNHQTNVLESKDFTQGGYEKTLLIFYESGCGPCENLLQQLPGNYQNLKKKGIRIIAISADKDPATFKETSKNFPWEDTYCDFEGMGGFNFQNYGVAGTPTIFLLDRLGKVEAKMAGLDEVLDELK